MLREKDGHVDHDQQRHHIRPEHFLPADAPATAHVITVVEHGLNSLIAHNARRCQFHRYFRVTAAEKRLAPRPKLLTGAGTIFSAMRPDLRHFLAAALALLAPVCTRAENLPADHPTAAFV